MCKCDRTSDGKHNCDAEISPDGIKVSYLMYDINDKGGEVLGMEEKKGFLIEGGLYYKKDVLIDGVESKLILTGSQEALGKIEKGDKLMVLDKGK